MTSTSRPANREPFEVRREHTPCVVCEGDDPVPYKARMYAIGSHTFDLARCRRCGFVYVEPRPDGPTLGRMYDDVDYYQSGYSLGVEDKGYFERKDELLEVYDQEFQRIEREVGGPGSVLELGSAGGFLLEAARRRGWSVRGVELSPPSAKYSREVLGLDVFEGLLEDAPFEDESFDLAIADNVLEHTTAPVDVLRHLRRLLKPGGHLIVIVPTYVNSPYFRLLLWVGRWVPQRFLGRDLLRILKMDPDHDGGFPYHILEFERSSLLRLLRRAEFDVGAVERSVPLPAHLFKVERPSLRVRLLRASFRVLDAGMRIGLLPGARLRVVVRRPS